MCLIETVSRADDAGPDQLLVGLTRYLEDVAPFLASHWKGGAGAVIRWGTITCHMRHTPIGGCDVT